MLLSYLVKLESQPLHRCGSVCAAMPVTVDIHLMISGEFLHKLTMRHHTTVLNVKEQMRHEINVMKDKKMDQMTLLIQEGDQGARCLEESELLLDLTWFVLRDVCRCCYYKHVTFELQLFLIIEPKRCVVCNKTSLRLKKCGGCGSVRYCSTECQKTHRLVHKAHCF